MSDETFSLKIKTSKEQAKNLLEMLGNKEEIDMPAIPLTEVKAYTEGNRKNIWEITINMETMMHVESNKKSAAALVEMLEYSAAEELVLPKLKVSNIRDFVAGDRDNLLLIEFRKERMAKEDIPGNLA